MGQKAITFMRVFSGSVTIFGGGWLFGMTMAEWSLQTYHDIHWTPAWWFLFGPVLIGLGMMALTLLLMETRIKALKMRLANTEENWNDTSNDVASRSGH
jgi:hypothetical protein